MIRRPSGHRRLVLCSVAWAVISGCAAGVPPNATGSDAGTDAGSVGDAGAGIDAGGQPDGGGGIDAGQRLDAGFSDAGAVDAGGAVDGGDCDGGCSFARSCCNGQCTNPANDPENCGGCGVQCSGSTPYCNNTCQAAPCTLAPNSCALDGGSCCGQTCCGPGQLCCEDEGPVSGFPTCFTPTAQQSTCPQGCAPLCQSDREAKRDLLPADDHAILDALAHVPISTWSYKDGDASVRHLGPMAQDFRAAFQLGGTERAYDPVDAHGVAFSSIRALYALVQEQNLRLEKLERENAQLRKRLGGKAPRP